MSQMTLTGLNLKSRKALTATFNQVNPPPRPQKIKIIQLQTDFYPVRVLGGIVLAL